MSGKIPLLTAAGLLAIGAAGLMEMGRTNSAWVAAPLEPPPSFARAVSSVSGPVSLVPEPLALADPVDPTPIATPERAILVAARPQAPVAAAAASPVQTVAPPPASPSATPAAPAATSTPAPAVAVIPPSQPPVYEALSAETPPPAHTPTAKPPTATPTPSPSQTPEKPGNGPKQDPQGKANGQNKLSFNTDSTSKEPPGQAKKK